MSPAELGRRSMEQARGRDTAGWGGRRTDERSGQRQERIVGDRRVVEDEAG